MASDAVNMIGFGAGSLSWYININNGPNSREVDVIRSIGISLSTIE